MSRELMGGPHSAPLPPAGRGPGPAPYWTVLGALWGLPAAVGAVWWLLSPDENPGGQCEGIGFGCTLTPRDSVLFLGLLASPVLVLEGLLAVGLIALARWRRRVREGRS
ncbi:hypothetical protein KQI48_15655 [Cellulomonas hominis]|uniref:hypothetical protein n=1 Tax=Cellulomonas hominis TaxID=156981 RepID=UPI001C112FDB|nr:hypothetical protein [Cellulomonas hominis]MBU5424105.1 hypothetical protein [Cellulomonas hominis]